MCAFALKTNVTDENVKIYVIKKNKIIKIITFKNGNKYYKSVEGGIKNGA